jgi:hypothetical protein
MNPESLLPIKPLNRAKETIVWIGYLQVFGTIWGCSIFGGRDYYYSRMIFGEMT